MNLFYQPLIPEGTHHLDAEESKHCVKALRKKAGDQIGITDGKGFFYEAIITKANPFQCDFKIVNQVGESRGEFFIHIAIAPTKNTHRIEWFVEKAVEFGIQKITFIECERSEAVHLKPERLKKIAISAMKQSVKASLPTIEGPVSVKELISNAPETVKFIAHVDYANAAHLKDVAKKMQQYVVLIGPEGDFSPDELEWAQQHAFVKVSLGSSRLRTETAGMAACHILNLINSQTDRLVNFNR